MAKLNSSLGYNSDGKRKQKKKRGFKTKKEAQKALAEAINAVNTGIYIVSHLPFYIKSTWTIGF